MGKVEKILKFVTLNVSQSMGREMIIIQREDWDWIKICIIKSNIGKNYSKGESYE